MNNSLSDSPTISWWNNFFKDAGIPVGLSASYAITFSENRISMRQISELDADLLKMIGILAIGHIMSILKYAKTYTNNSNKSRMSYPMETNFNQMNVPSSMNYIDSMNNQMNYPTSSRANMGASYNNNENFSNYNMYQDKIKERERQLMLAGERKMLAQQQASRRSLPTYIDDDGDDHVHITHVKPPRRKTVVVATGRPTLPIVPKRFKTSAHMDKITTNKPHKRSNTIGTIKDARDMARIRYSDIKTVAHMDKKFNRSIVKRIGVISPIKTPKARVSFDNKTKNISIKDRIGLSTNSPKKYSNSPKQFNKSPIQFNKSPRQFNKSPIQFNKSPKQFTKSPIQFNKFNNSPKPYKKFSVSPNTRVHNVREKFTNFGLNIKNKSPTRPLKTILKSPKSSNVTNRLGNNFTKPPGSSHGIFSISPKANSLKIKDSSVFNRLG